ncbi:MerR family transcriptional regulator [uncultured Ilyobacter sp.]|uniref:MerR family transcriptional regulator n=1 Tax=uncultured Ilyobacter sp. TaxID=544433 RepID=UPI0029F48AF6|nr:MerR family transcriptional regulator [uncultured Ilyobacter sp.]
MYSIGEFSKKVNLSIHTLRYYEKEGIISPNRNEINKRRYSDKDIEWIEFIKKLKNTNMPIKEIKKYSILREKGEITLNERMSMLVDHRKNLIIKINDMKNGLEKLNDKIIFYKKSIKK